MDNCITLLNDYNIDKNDLLIIAVSGGIDSMVLIDYLFKNNYNLFAVHFNHQTRKENIDEENLIIKYCSNYKIPFQVIKLNVNNKGNFHNNARNLRYKHLKRIANKHNTKYILTAHHLDDLAENILIKITRGSNLYGYAGMHPYLNNDDFIFIRPLLYTNKKEIINYANNNQIPFLEDSSNKENIYLRNRIRHNVLPYLKKENENFDNRIINYHLQLKKAYEFSENYLNTLNIIKNDKVNIKLFKKESDFIQELIISKLTNNYNLFLNYDTLLNLKELILDDDKPNAFYNLENNFIFIKEYNYFFITENEYLNNKKIRITLKEGENILPNMEIITLLFKPHLDTKEFIKICYNKLEWPLILRNRENGDKLKFSFGHKKLKDFLIDKKIPLQQRNQLLVLTDSNNVILWVENLYLNKHLGNNNCLYLYRGELC